MVKAVDALQANDTQGFSPLHEGDTSVVRPREHIELRSQQRFSPLHEGDTSVVTRHPAPSVAMVGFQSPSRGGHLRGVT